MQPFIRFPTDQEQLERDAAEYRDRTPDARIQRLLEVSALCRQLLAASPTASAQRRLLEQEEVAENAAWRRLLRRHADG